MLSREEVRREVFQFMGVLGMLTSILSITGGILVVYSNPIAFVSTVMTFIIMDLLVWLNWHYRVLPLLNNIELVTCARSIIAIVFYSGAMLVLFSFFSTYPIYGVTFMSLGVTNLVLGIVLTYSYICRIRELKSRFWTFSES